MAQIFRGPATLNVSAATENVPASLVVISASTDVLLRESNSLNREILAQLKIQNAHLAEVTDDVRDETDIPTEVS